MSWWRRVFSKRRMDQEVDAELRFHFELEVAAKMRSGISEAEARRRTRLEFGGLEQLKEDCRETRGTMWMASLIQDLRFAVRQLCKNPGFTFVAVLTLALGIGANSAIFSVVDAVLLHPLGFHEPSRLVAVMTTEPGRHDDPNVSYPAFLDWRARNHVFDGISAFREDDFTMTGKAEPAHLTGVVASANLFSVLGVAPWLGRDFLPEEDKPSTTGQPIILSHSLWQSRLAGDRRILGKSLTLDGRAFTVVGVMPADFQFPVQRIPVDFWTTIALDGSASNGSPPMTEQRGAAYLDVIGRLKPRVSLPAAQAEMGQIQSALNKQYPENRPRGISILRLIDVFVGEMRQGLFILFGAVGLILLIACANLANLLLARATVRRNEISVRAALGASRLRIVRQLLTESLLLAMAGAAVGLGLAAWGIPVLTKMAPGDLPRITDSGLNLQVLVFTGLVAVFTSVVFGLVPALRGATRGLAVSLREGGRSGTETRTQSRLRSALIVTEMALAMVLLVSAGLLLRTLLDLGRVDPGFAKDHVITFGLDLPGRYGHVESVGFYRQLLAGIRATPGVRSASAAFPLPLSADDVKTSFDVEGHPMKQSERPVTTFHIVDRDYFRTLGIPLVEGREFTPQDEVLNATPVVIISQRLAKQAFPHEDPIGKRIKPGIASGSSTAPMRVVVGVAGDVKAEGLSAPSVPESYVPYAQLPFAPMSVIVRTNVSPQSVVPTLRNEVQALDKDLPLLHVKTLDEYLNDSISGTRFEAILLGTFALLAFLLAAIGLYGVISYTVVQKTRELGIRLALGANRNMILRMVVMEGALLACAGTLIGLAGAFVLTRLVASLLYGVGPNDPLTFSCVPVVLVMVAVLASYVPARRAAKVDPMVALRYE